MEREPDQRHNHTGDEQRGRWPGPELRGEGAERSRAGAAVKIAQAEESEGARDAAEKQILQPGLGGARVAFIEGGEDIKREPGQLEPDKNHQQFLAPDEQQQPDRGQEEQSKKFTLVR